LVERTNLTVLIKLLPNLSVKIFLLRQNVLIQLCVSMAASTDLNLNGRMKKIFLFGLKETKPNKERKKKFFEFII
jgi:hypothetical protein